MIQGMKPIEPSIRNFISGRKLYVLRDSQTGNALNTSYTPEGLYWTTNVSGKLIYFRNARLERVYDKTTKEPLTVKIVGDTRPNDKVYIEKFVPRDRPTVRGQIAEYTWTDKAVWLCAQTA